MKRFALAAGIVLAASVPAAMAKSPSSAHVRQYSRAYHAVVAKFGEREPGRNIVRWGLPHRAASDADVVRSLAVLHRMLAPPPPPPPPTVSYSPTAVVPQPAVSQPAPPAPTYSSAGASGVPACASESGTNYSTGPDNTNPSGATGRYQVIPSTHAAICPDLGWSPPEQDACAARIYAAQGAGAWVGCGG